MLYLRAHSESNLEFVEAWLRSPHERGQFCSSKTKTASPISSSAGSREEGFTVERAADGPTGRHLLQSGVWDVVLLDWRLPGEDGLSLLRGSRAAGHTAPVLFLARGTPSPTAFAASIPAPTIIFASRSHSRNCWRGSVRSLGVLPILAKPF